MAGFAFNWCDLKEIDIYAKPADPFEDNKQCKFFSQIKKNPSHSLHILESEQFKKKLFWDHLNHYKFIANDSAMDNCLNWGYNNWQDFCQCIRSLCCHVQSDLDNLPHGLQQRRKPSRAQREANRRSCLDILHKVIPELQTSLAYQKADKAMENRRGYLAIGNAAVEGAAKALETMALIHWRAQYRKTEKEKIRQIPSLTEEEYSKRAKEIIIPPVDLPTLQQTYPDYYRLADEIRRLFHPFGETETRIATQQTALEWLKPVIPLLNAAPNQSTSNSAHPLQTAWQSIQMSLDQTRQTLKMQRLQTLPSAQRLIVAFMDFVPTVSSTKDPLELRHMQEDDCHSWRRLLGQIQRGTVGGQQPHGEEAFLENKNLEELRYEPEAVKRLKAELATLQQTLLLQLHAANALADASARQAQQDAVLTQTAEKVQALAAQTTSKQAQAYIQALLQPLQPWVPAQLNQTALNQNKGKAKLNTSASAPSTAKPKPAAHPRMFSHSAPHTAAKRTSQPAKPKPSAPTTAVNPTPAVKPKTNAPTANPKTASNSTLFKPQNVPPVKRKPSQPPAPAGATGTKTKRN